MRAAIVSAVNFTISKNVDEHISGVNVRKGHHTVVVARSKHLHKPIVPHNMKNIVARTPGRIGDKRRQIFPSPSAA